MNKYRVARFFMARGV